MLCKSPFIRGNLAFGCGQCLPCRINKRREWTHRIMLESLKHSDSSFVTLTYSDEFLPKDGSLVPKHYQDWLKRLRKAVEPTRIRYFVCGEYGEISQRPHYHVALFGLRCLLPHMFPKSSRYLCNCAVCNLIRETWSMGRIQVDLLEHDSAGYVCGYVTKKMTNSNNEVTKKWLNGRHPEFARMSLKPGIGALAMEDVASLISDSEEFHDFIFSETGDVPKALKKFGNRSLPLGRYLRSKLRESLGLEKASSKEDVFNYSQELSRMLEDALSDPQNSKKGLKQLLQEKNAQKALNIETKQKIFSKKGKI